MRDGLVHLLRLPSIHYRNVTEPSYHYGVILHEGRRCKTWEMKTKEEEKRADKIKLAFCDQDL